MRKLCPHCLHIGKGKFEGSIYERIFNNRALGIISIALGIYIVINYYDVVFSGFGLHSLLNFEIFIAMVSPLLYGFINLRNYHRGGKSCPKCVSKNMLPINDPSAVKVIRKYGLLPDKNDLIVEDKTSEPVQSS